MHQTPGTENVDLLFKNLHKGLQVYSAQELNEAIVGLILKKTTKGEETDFILDQVCETYKITKRTLFTGKIHKVFEARKLASCLLHYELGLSIRRISVILKQKAHNKCGEATRYYKTINKRVKVDREFEEKYRNIQINLITSMNKKETHAA
jgi:chromosomal replication initiation ATPase DnaA